MLLVYSAIGITAQGMGMMYSVECWPFAATTALSLSVNAEEPISSEKAQYPEVHFAITFVALPFISAMKASAFASMIGNEP